MSFLNKIIVENANRLRITSPIYVRENPMDDSSVRYLPTRRLMRFPLGIQFGWDSMFMDYDSFGFLICHEFAHVAHGDLRWMLDEISLSPFLRILARVRQICRQLPKSETQLNTSQDEFNADNFAANFYPKEAFGRNLIASLAAITAYVELRDTGKVGGVDPIWDKSTIAVPDNRFEDLSLKESCTIILSTFRADRSAFEICAVRGRKEDEPEDYHPSIQDRLSNLGLDWDTMQSSCDFRPEVLLDMEEFCKWATPEFRLVSVPKWNGISVPYDGL